jgi:hypothetical protein
MVECMGDGTQGLTAPFFLHQLLSSPYRGSSGTNRSRLNAKHNRWAVANRP